MADLSKHAALLMDEPEPPTVLWVANTVMTDAMTMPHEGEPLDVGDHYDWLLAAGGDRLGVIRVQPSPPLSAELRWAFPYADLHIDVEDQGLLDRRRVFLLTLPDGRWAAFGARLTGRRRASLDRFTAEVRRRCDVKLRSEERSPEEDAR